MPRRPTADRDLTALGARLTFSGALDEFRADPDGFARLVVAMARVAGSEATVLEHGLTSSVFGSIPDRVDQATEAGSSKENR